MRKLIYLFHKYLVECHYITLHCNWTMFLWAKLFIYAKNICKTYPIGIFFTLKDSRKRKAKFEDEHIRSSFCWYKAENVLKITILWEVGKTISTEIKWLRILISKTQKFLKNWKVHKFFVHSLWINLEILGSSTVIGDYFCWKKGKLLADILGVCQLSHQNGRIYLSIWTKLIFFGMHQNAK